MNLLQAIAIVFTLAGAYFGWVFGDLVGEPLRGAFRKTAAALAAVGFALIAAYLFTLVMFYTELFLALHR